MSTPDPERNSPPTMMSMPQPLQHNSSSPNISMSATKNAYYQRLPQPSFNKSPKQTSRQAGKITAAPMSLGVGGGNRAGRIVQGTY